MFEDSLIESGNRLKTKRGLTTSISVMFQLGLIAVMVLIPLIFTEALPKANLSRSWRRRHRHRLRRLRQPL